MNRTDNLKDWGLALLRIGVGGVFAAHGAQKLFGFGIPGVSGLMTQIGVPFPMLSAVAVTAAEFLGGLALVAGFGARLAAIPIAFSMLVAALTVHLKNGFFLPAGVEYVLVLFLASVALSLTGSGALSVDRWLENRAAAKKGAGETATRRVDLANVH
jgi:putative oxidoreductase